MTVSVDLIHIPLVEYVLCILNFPEFFGGLGGVGGGLVVVVGKI